MHYFIHRFLVNDDFYFRVKVEFATYVMKKKGTGGGPPPTPPKFTPLMEAAASLIGSELEMAELQYNSMCQELPGETVASSLPETCLVVQEGKYGKQHLQLCFPLCA